MKGYPLYNIGDTVSFILDETLVVGEIAIIDKFGTFEDNTDVSYDIFNEKDNCLYKHIREDKILPYNGACQSEPTLQQIIDLGFEWVSKLDMTLRLTISDVELYLKFDSDDRWKLTTYKKYKKINETTIKTINEIKLHINAYKSHTTLYV